MSYLDNKTLDITLEENTDFGFQLTFETVTQECQTHPVTGEDLDCKDVRTPLPVDSLTFLGSISASLGDSAEVLASFTFSMLDAGRGVVQMTLPRDTINTLTAVRAAKHGDSRSRVLGFYDVVTRDTAADITTRIMQGRVLVSDGVTV